MKEYGGYIELERFHGSEYHTGDVLRFNYGRTAWQYLLEERGIKKVWLPYYICDSLIAPAERSGVEIAYYHIDDRFCPLCDHIPEDGEAILIVNYFGFLSQEVLERLVEKYHRVIVDNTQAFFAAPLDGVDTLYSCRKFFGVPDGGYLYAQGISSLEKEKDNSSQRMDFLLGRVEDGAQKHYAEFRKAEDYAKEESVKKMSDITRNLLCGIDYAYVKEARRNNYQRLHKKLGAHNALKVIPIPDGAYIYPLYYAGDAAKMRAFLVGNHVYVPVLWSNVHNLLKEDCLEICLTDHVLPLPVDQRYSAEDMDEIVAIVKRGIEVC